MQRSNDNIFKVFLNTKISTKIVWILLFRCNARSYIKWNIIQVCRLHTLSQALLPVSFGLIINNEFHFFSIYRHKFVSLLYVDVQKQLFTKYIIIL